MSDDPIVVFGSVNSGNHTWTQREYAAVQVLARDVVAQAYERARDQGIIGWEDYPELAELDMEYVLQEAYNMIPELDAQARAAAVAVLAPRAQNI